MFRSHWLRNLLDVTRSRKDRRHLAMRRHRTQRRTRLNLEPLEDRTLLTAWTGLGPAPLLGEGPLGNGSTGTDSGRITGIAADPTNANIIYVATAGGGIWETTDAQDASPKWTPLTDKIPGTTDSMGAIAIAPSDSNVLYAGTGEANNSGDSNYGEGILVSTTGGSSWTLENPNGMFTGLTVAKIAIDPTNADIAYAAVANVGSHKAYISGTGIYKTMDGGATWTNTTASITTSAAFSDVAIDPDNSSIIYAAVGAFYGDAANGIYESTNGSSWSLLSNFLTGTSVGRISLAIAPSNPSIIYAAGDNPTNGKLAAMEESTDGGANWTTLSNTPNFVNTQGNYDLSIAVDPTNPAIVYAGGAAGPMFGEPAAVIYSTDSGVDWSDLDLTKSAAVTPHADHHAFAFDASGNLLDGDDGGIFRLDSAAPILWSDINGNLSTVQFENISINPGNGNVLGGSQDNGTDLYNAASGIWTATDGGDGGQAVFATNTLAYRVSPVGSFGATNFFRVSHDGGLTWTAATSGLNGKDPMNFYPPFAIDPSNPDRVLFGSNQIYQTTNAALQWSALTSTGANGWNPNGNAVDSIAIAASDANTIYAVTGGDFADSSQIFVSSDGGITWKERDLPVGSGRVNQIIVDPNNAQTAYAVVSIFGGGHVFETTNSGQTWTDISGNLPNMPTWSIQIDAAHQTLYVGNDEGVFSSTDGGATWNPLGTGLPNAQVFSLDYSSTLNVLVAGTHGRGAWEFPTAAPIVTANPTDQTVTAGQTASFTATATSVPTATVQWQVSSDGGKTWDSISGATSTTLTLTNVGSSQNGNEYQAVFTNGAGSSTSTAATLNVQYAPQVTGNPANGTVVAGQTATFTAAASSNPATYGVQWQVSTNGGKTFTAISGATNATLILTKVQPSQNGYEYSAVFTNIIGSTTTSAATLTVQYAPTVTTNATDETVTAGQTAIFTAAADANPTASVQWQVSSDGGNTFTDISGATSATLTLMNVAFSLNGDEYRAEFTNSIGAVLTSAATLTVQTIPTVTTSPSNQTVTAGQTATFTAAASGSPTPTVQWQISTDGGKTFSDISGATSTTLTLTNVQASQNGSEYQAVFTNNAGSVTTSTASLTVLYAPVVLGNPSDATVTAGQTATFTAAANANPTATVQWQVSSDGGNTFTDISGATSTTLILTNVAFSRNGTEYRALFTNSVGTTPTNAATLTVYIPPVLTANPSNQTLLAGGTATFTASADGNPTPTVQWQISTDGGTTFSNIGGATSTTLTLNNVQDYQNGYEYQAVFTNIVGTATTNVATLIVPYAPSVRLDLNNQTVTAGQSATFTAAVNGNPAPTVQWQVSSDGGKTFTSISGATSPTLTLNNIQPSQNGYEYRAVFTNSLGTASTVAATLTVLSAPSVTLNPSDQTVTAGQKATFTATASGYPAPAVQWQVSTDGGQTFSDMSGAISTTLTLVGTTNAMNGNEYRAVFTNSTGSSTTTAATLTVNPAVAPFITSNPISPTVSAGASVSFTASAGGNPTPIVQWQVSTDGGATFRNISGATSPTLTLTGVTPAMNGYQYQAVFGSSSGTATSLSASLTVKTTSAALQLLGLDVPPLLALIDQFLGGVETISANETKTITYSLFGYPLIVAKYNSSGDFVSATLFGIGIPNWIWLL